MTLTVAIPLLSFVCAGFLSGTDAQTPIYKPGTGQIPNWVRKYPVVGQGVLSFNTIRNSAFAIVVNQRDSKDWISLDVHDGLAFFTVFLKGVQDIVAVNNEPDAGYDKDLKVSYWFSYNRDQLVIKYGKGHVMDETTLLEYDFLAGVPENETMNVRNETKTLFNPEYERFAEQYDSDTPKALKKQYKNVKKALESMGKDSSMEGILSMEKRVSFDKNPLVSNRPFLVLDSNDISLFSLDKGNFTFSASLPITAKELYENVKTTDLNYPVDASPVLLSDAIRYSINNPGCILYNKLREKVGEFGGLNETYLRVTLGSSYGDSPGIPYVLEIWPAGHFSPVHNHGNSNAVIKVLFGTINVGIYNKFTPDINGDLPFPPPKLFSFDGFPGNFTWIDANWYQTHKLENFSDDFCATVQCYKYPDDDNIHWPYFDFISEQDQIREFIPESDFDFIPMREQVMHELQYGCGN